MTASRVERLVEEQGLPGREVAEAWVQRADRGYWALYRALDLSQSEVMDAVATPVDASQATVSRAIKDGDTRALADPDYLELEGTLPEEYVKGGPRGRPYPDEWLEAYRDALARATVERRALRLIADPHKFTPEWAAQLYPELVGCNLPVAEFHDYPEQEIHHDDHLNRLESVNTDRWR